jgi:ornithine cyclodeaminase/alanine dehydrogenase
MLFSAETGKIVAVMDGGYITAMRTACASALATKILARAQTPVMGILGAGVQARAHIEALARVRKLAKIKIYSPSGTSAPRIREALEPAIGIPIEVSASAEDAVRDSDIVVTVSTAKEPIVRPHWLKPGVHINAVGSHRPDLREIDGATLARAKIVVDSREAIMAECGDILLALKENSISPDAIHAEMGELLAGGKAGRIDDDEITLYKSVGIAVQDVAAAHLVYRKALQRGVGTHVAI